MVDPSASLYENRPLVEGYPGLDALSFKTKLAPRAEDRRRIKGVVHYLDRLIDIGRTRNFLVVGCGPQPEPIRILREMGFAVVGVEPVPEFAAAARQYLDDESAVLEGAAELLPAAKESQNVVLLESVLEHVDSVGRSLAEVKRVLVPGGVVYINTTNRHELRRNPEFNVRFFQWLPDALKESYVFRHLHYEPSLANYTERPAVHWFTFSELCGLGREAGFCQFYSPIDLKTAKPSSFSGSDRTRRLKAKALVHVQRYPALRAFALSQLGGQIFMVKRTKERLRVGHPA